MSTNIIFTRQNYDQSSRKFIYNFATSQKFVNKQVSLSSLSLYNSFKNISIENGNNTITFEWLGTTYSHTFDDGYYSVSEINYSLQKTLILNKLYVVTTNNEYGFYINIVANAIRYAGQILFSKIPTSSEANAFGYTIPTGATWTFPEVSITATLTFNSKFGNLLGFEAGTYPIDQSLETTITSTKSPAISVVSSLILTCSLVSNIGVSIPHDTFFSFGLDAPYGDLMKVQPYPVFSNCRNAQYESIEIAIYDQNLNKLDLYDIEGNIGLSIIEKP
jgi:hypothetical protein